MRVCSPEFETASRRNLKSIACWTLFVPLFFISHFPTYMMPNCSWIHVYCQIADLVLCKMSLVRVLSLIWCDMAAEYFENEGQHQSGHCVKWTHVNLTENVLICTFTTWTLSVVLTEVSLHMQPDAVTCVVLDRCLLNMNILFLWVVDIKTFPSLYTCCCFKVLE